MLTYPFDDYGIINRISNVTIDHAGPANILVSRKWENILNWSLNILGRCIILKVRLFISMYFTQLVLIFGTSWIDTACFFYQSIAPVSYFQKMEFIETYKYGFIKISHSTTYKIRMSLFTTKSNTRKYQGEA